MALLAGGVGRRRPAITKLVLEYYDWVPGSKSSGLIPHTSRMQDVLSRRGHQHGCHHVALSRLRRGLPRGCHRYENYVDPIRDIMVQDLEAKRKRV
jgi:hypothetical protein